MPRGAPKGNHYASKEEDEREHGISFTYYLDAYEYEFLQKSVEYDGKKPTDANIRKKARELTKEAIRQDMIETFARYKQEKRS
jgi:hypothetical protein